MRGGAGATLRAGSGPSTAAVSTAVPTRCLMASPSLVGPGHRRAGCCRRAARDRRRRCRGRRLCRRGTGQEACQQRCGACRMHGAICMCCPFVSGARRQGASIRSTWGRLVPAMCNGDCNDGKRCGKFVEQRHRFLLAVRICGASATRRRNSKLPRLGGHSHRGRESDVRHVLQDVRRRPTQSHPPPAPRPGS
jgi:hypothetical protein